MRVWVQGTYDDKPKVMNFDDALDIRNDCEPYERIKPEEFRRQLEQGPVVEGWFTYTKEESADV